MTRAAYVGVVRETYDFKTPVRFRFRFFTYIGNRSRPTKPRPNIQYADDAISSNEDALVLE